MGIRTKLNPQSDIHLKCSSGVALRALAGSGEKKSSMLKPFHRGNAFFATAKLSTAGMSAGDDAGTDGIMPEATAEPAAVTAAVVSEVRIKSLLFICEDQRYAA